MNSELKLAVEMTKLSDTMQGLKAAVERQENQLKSFPENKFQDIQLIPNRAFSEERQLVEDELMCGGGADLHASESEISHGSHWSGSLDLIHSSVTELKNTLRSQDRQVTRLTVENEELRNELRKKEKELKKQRILLKAEREAFEQYKREFCNEVKKKKNDEFLDVTEQVDKSSKEMKKLDSELVHYKQLYLEHSHTVNRLTKEVNNLKSDNIHLKGKLLQQDRRFNKLILEMAQRFKKSKEEMDLFASKEFESLPPQKINVALYRTAERNARLAFDNSMLKRDVESLKQQLLDKISEEKTVKYLSINKRYSSNLSNNVSQTNLNNLNQLLKKSPKPPLHQTKSSISKRNKEKVVMWKPKVDQRSSSNINVKQSKCVTDHSSEHLVRTYSAPEVTKSYIELLSKKQE